MDDDVRQRIINSLFSKRGPSGVVEEQYISHCKIYEDAGPNQATGVDEAGRKARYILLSLPRAGAARIHKSKANPNGTFSIGKTWNLEDLRSLEVLSISVFNITFQRMYRWQTEDPEEQAAFLKATVRLFRRVTGGKPLQLIGLIIPEGNTSSMASRSSGPQDENNWNSRRDASTTPPIPTSSGSSRGTRPTQLSMTDSPPRSGSPGLFTPKQSSGLRTTSPKQRHGVLFTNSDRTSFDTPPGTAVGNGRPSLELPRGGKMSVVPTPSASPLAPGMRPASPLRRSQTRTPDSRLASPNDVNGMNRVSPRSAQQRPQELERRSFDRGRSSFEERRRNDPPAGSRNRGGSRSDVAPSPPPNWDVHPEFPRRPMGPAARSDQGASPPNSDHSSRQIGMATPMTRPRGLSASKLSGSPQPPPIPDTANLAPTRRRREGESGSNSREPSRTRQEPTQLPPEIRRTPATATTPLPIPGPSTRTPPAPLQKLRQQPEKGLTPRKDPNARISFFDPANQPTADRLLAANTKAVLEDDTAEGTMANVEEMLEGYEWTALGAGLGAVGGRGAADQIEARLLKELTALDAANMYSFVESDDRVAIVLKYIEEAVKELDEMDALVQSYKIHLNSVAEDISYIQGQNKGLQVQTQNQKALLNELENLLQTIHVDKESLVSLTREPLDKTAGILRLEEAATELYKALLAGRDTDMAATMERLDEYRTHNSQLCQRLVDFLPVMITFQSKNILEAKDKGRAKDKLVIASHEPLETYLLRYQGLMRYLKEMDEPRYGKLCAAYFSGASDLYKEQIKAVLMAYINLVRKASDEEGDSNFSPQTATVSRGATIRRAGTIVRSPLDSRPRDKAAEKDGELRGYEAFGRILDQMAPLIYREEKFMGVWLQISETGETFADYMNLDSYFRRQAARSVGFSPNTLKLIRGAMDLVFGFLPAELKQWVDGALSRDGLQMIGIIAHLERYMSDAEERGNMFLVKQLQKLHQKMVLSHARYTEDQIKSIESFKLASKKRRGVIHFIRYFPTFVGRVESQLAGADSYEIRNLVDSAYEKLVTVMFETLQHIAKLEGDGEDKGQFIQHVIIIENMHSFIADMAQHSVGSVTVYTRRAEALYDENLSAYVKLTTRRFFAKLIDFLEGAERLLSTTSPLDVSRDSNHNKAALKKVLKDFSGKDMRRCVDAMYKRVEKHFEEEGSGGAGGSALPGTLSAEVWKACEDDLVNIIERFRALVSKCYGGDGGMEFGVPDVEAAFKKHRT